MKKLLLAFVVLLTINCNKTEEITYFGGEIVNPKDDYVYLHFEDEVLDSASLDDQNRFHFKLNHPKEGLYRFFHGREYQYIILENGDSLMLRLNTLEFDESLIFSGLGAEKNNFLLDMWLLEEDENYLMKRLYRAVPEVFLRKADSIRDMKLEEYTKLLDEADLSPLAEHITKATIDYPYYTTKEYYASEHKFWLGLENKPKLPDNFYNHREHIDLNDNSLVHLISYFTYLNAYFDRLTNDKCQGECSIGGKWSAYHYATHKLNLVDSLITQDKLRSLLFERTAIKYFQYDHDPENNENFITFYRKLTNGQNSSDIDMVYQAINNLRMGANFPVMELYDKQGAKHSLDSAWFDKKTVFYIWNSDQKGHARNTIHHMRKMADKFPEYQFIGINLDPDQQTWLNTMSELGIEGDSQLRAPDMKYIIKRFGYLRLNRMVVVDINGKVIEGFGDIYNLTPLEYHNKTQKLANTGSKI